MLVDYDLCIGCRACVEACPYDARTFERDPRHTYVDFPLGGSDIPVIQPDIAEKCTFYSERIDAGLEPFCVEVCPARARYFGDLNDPGSTVSKIIREGQAEVLLPELGTGPAVYYVFPQHSVSAPTGPDLIASGYVGAATEKANS